MTDANTLPFLTGAFAGLGGVIKKCVEDFYVEELPLYEASGQGTHNYLFIEKREITTMDALNAIARALGVAARDIGYAGQKDARAVARQWISVEHIKPEVIAKINVPKVRILDMRRHGNKLKMGHLAGNRFSIRLRELAVEISEAKRIADEVLAILQKRGVPNYFGPQRFGNRADSHILGELVIRGKSEEFVDHFLGRPQEGELPAFVEARRAYEQGDFKKALDAWPYNFADQRRALRAIIETGIKKKAYNVVDKNLKKFFVSAFQSQLFNEVLAARMPGIDKILAGDMAYKHVNGAMFAVEDAAIEQPRCEAFEISPTGPLIGASMRKLTGAAGEIENPVIERPALTERDLQQLDNYARGGRRPLRFAPRNCSVDAGSDDMGKYLELRFDLDSGCYATTLLREICKTDIS